MDESQSQNRKKAQKFQKNVICGLKFGRIPCRRLNFFKKMFFQNICENFKKKVGQKFLPIWPQNGSKSAPKSKKAPKFEKNVTCGLKFGRIPGCRLNFFQKMFFQNICENFKKKGGQKFLPVWPQNGSKSAPKSKKRSKFQNKLHLRAKIRPNCLPSLKIF